MRLLMLVAAIFFAGMALKAAVIDRSVVDTALLTAATVCCLVSSIFWKKGTR